MDKVKQWIAVTVLTALAVLAGGWFLVVAPARGEAAELRDQALVQEGTNTSLTTSLEVLRTKAEGLPEKEAELAEVARRLPAGPELPALLRSLVDTAAASGVRLTSVVPAPPVVVAPPVPAVPAEGSPAADPAAAPPPPAAPVATGVSSMELKLVVVGDFYAVEHFVALLEELPRAFRVIALSMDQGSDAPDGAAAGADGEVRASLTGLVYLAPQTTPAATAGSPAGGAQPAPATASTPAS